MAISRNMPANGRPLTRKRRPWGWEGPWNAIKDWADSHPGAGERPKPSKPVSSPKPLPGTGTFRPALTQPAKPSKPKPSGWGSAVSNLAESASNAASNAANRPRPPKAPSKAPNKAPSGVTRGGSSGSGTRGTSSGTRGGGTLRNPGGGLGGNRRVVTRNGVQGGAAAGVQDELEKIVDAIIAGQIAPIQDQRRQMREQTAGNVIQNQRLNEGYQQQLAGLKDSATLDLGSALQKAAELNGISQQAIDANQDWLKSLMGQSNGGTLNQDVQQAEQQSEAFTNAGYASMGKELAANGQNMSDWLAKQGVANTSMTNEQINQERLRLAAAERDMASQIAQVKGQRLPTLYQMQSAARDQALKEQVAQSEWGLKADQLALDRWKAQTDANIAGFNADTDRMEAQAQANKGTAPGRYAGVPKRYDQQIAKVWGILQKAAGEGKLTAPWKSAFTMLQAQGLSPAYTAIVASRWYGDSLAKQGPRGALALLNERGVPIRFKRQIIEGMFGPRGWRVANTRPGVGGGLDIAQSALDAMQGGNR